MDFPKSAFLLIGSFPSKCAETLRTCKGRHEVNNTPIYEHTPLTLKVKTIIFPSLRLSFISLPSRSSSLSHAWMTTVFYIFFRGANHREWVSVLYTASLYKSRPACWQWNQWLTESSRDGRRCHRKAWKSVCEREKSTSLPFTSLSGFPSPHLQLNTLQLVLLFSSQSLITLQLTSYTE